VVLLLDRLAQTPEKVTTPYLARSLRWAVAVVLGLVASTPELAARAAAALVLVLATDQPLALPEPLDKATLAATLTILARPTAVAAEAVPGLRGAAQVLGSPVPGARVLARQSLVLL